MLIRKLTLAHCVSLLARRVSGGLDSLVMGEGQILAQVKDVYKVGQNAPGFGRQLNGLFKQAITAGKRVRAETSISSGAVSVSSAAAELAQLKLPTHNFDDSKVSSEAVDIVCSTSVAVDCVLKLQKYGSGIVAAEKVPKLRHLW